MPPCSRRHTPRVESKIISESYRLVQFAIREAVIGRTLDEVQSAKAALDEELRDYVRARVADTGVEVTELGVKDVILPGEIRELVNKVVEAERVAKANLIRRQEETRRQRGRCSPPG